MPGEKKLGKIFILFWYRSYTQTLKLYPEAVFLFHFHQTPLFFFIKIILIRICQSVKDGGGLMLVYRWVGVDQEQSRLGSKSYCSKNHNVTLLLFARNV